MKADCAVCDVAGWSVARAGSGHRRARPLPHPYQCMTIIHHVCGPLWIDRWDGHELLSSPAA